MKSFTDWIDSELKRRGWSLNELARRSGMSSASVSMVLSEQRKPGTEFCRSVADALQVPPEEVFRLAGLLPPLLPAVAEEREVVNILRSLPAQTRATVLDMLRGLGDGRPRSRVRTGVDEVVELFEGVEGGEEARILLDECRRLVAEVCERRG